MLKYSIILPCYNVSKYLLKCLKSIEKNDLYSCEIILVDDGSTDDTIKICNDFINNFEKNDNVKFNIISKPRGGGIVS